MDKMTITITVTLDPRDDVNMTDEVAVKGFFESGIDDMLHDRNCFKGWTVEATFDDPLNLLNEPKNEE